MNYKSVALELLSSDSFLVVNKKLIKKFGPNTAVFLSNLIDKYKYFQQKELLIDDGFFILRENLILEYGFTKRTILNCKTTLKNENIDKIIDKDKNKVYSICEGKKGTGLCLFPTISNPKICDLIISKYIP